MKPNKIIRFSFFLIYALIVTACVKEVSGGTGDPDNDKSDAMVRFSMAVPGTSGPSTRAMSESDESYIETVDVMVFRTDGDKKHYYTAPGHELDNSQINKKTFEAVLPVGTWDIIVLTNARAIINSSGIGQNEAKATALAKLTASFAANAADASKKLVGFRIPMMGHKAGIQIDGDTELTDKTGTGGVDNSIKMVRMVSRIDVSLSAKAASGSESGTGNANFALNSVRLYNYSTRGRVVPDLSSWPADNKATTPCPPNTGYGTAAYNGESYAPLTYTAADELSSEKNLPDALTRVIYTFEAAAGSSATPLSNPSLVIGGYYNGSSTESFYRVDFYDDNTKQYVALLRNHRHLANIRSVTGPGYDTPDKAFRSKPVNIEAEVLRWDESDMTGIAFDGQHTLSVSQNEFTFFRDERTASDDDNSLFVKTDYAPSTGSGGGWTIEKIVNAADGTTPVTWLTVTPTSGAVNVKTEAKLTFRENTSGSVRSAVVWFAAGRLRFPVTVTQTLVPEIGLNIYDPATNQPLTELIFAAPAGVRPVAQEFAVKWVPKSTSVNVTSTRVGNVVFPSGGNTGTPTAGTVTDASGTKIYTVWPTAITAAQIDPNTGNPFLERSSKIDFMVSNGFSYENRSIYLRQITYALVADTEGPYMLGNTYTFRVRSNALWRIKSVTQSTQGLLAPKAGDNLAVGLMGGGNTSPGNAVTFTVAPDSGTDLEGSITVVFESIDGLFDDVTVSLYCLANYDYTDNGRGLIRIYTENENDGNVVAYGTNTTCPSGYRLPTKNELTLMWIYKPAYPSEADIQNAEYWSTIAYPMPGYPSFSSYKWKVNMGTGHSDVTTNTPAIKRCIKNMGTTNKYPYVDITTDPANGPIIVSRDGEGGVPLTALHANWTETPALHVETGTTNRVAAKFQVALDDVAYNDCSTLGSGWRIPTQREMMLMHIMGAHPGTYDLGDAAFGDITAVSGFVPVGGAQNDRRIGTCTRSSLTGNSWWNYSVVTRYTHPQYGTCYGYAHVSGLEITTHYTRCVRDVE